MAAQMFAQSGTSCGCTRTGPGFDEGGGPTKTYPQFTICEYICECPQFTI